MASVQKHPKSPYWIAYFTGSNGKRHCKSTKLEATAGKRKAAQKIADSYEELYRTRTVIKTLRDNYADIATSLNKSWKIPTVKEFLSTWLKRNKPELAQGTHIKYTQRFNDLEKFLADSGRMNFDVCELMEDDSIPSEYRDKLLSSVSTVTAKNAMTILSGAFDDGKDKGYFIENHFHKLAKMKITDKSEKRPFALDELKLVLENCSPEWRSMVIFGLYTGQRLSDISELTWGQIDLKRNEISFITKKTSRRMALPIAKPLKEHISALRRGTPDAPLHRNAMRLIAKQGKAGTLSRQFNGILQKCNLVPKKAHRKRAEDPEGKSNRVTVNPLSFHSLRHTASTLLRMTGASEAVSREIIGHDSVSVDRGYVHMDSASMQTALDNLPDVTSA